MHSGGIDGAAAVAGPAAGRLLLSEISPEEHASAFFGLGVISDGPKPLLALVTKSLELRDEIPGSSPKGLKGYRDADAAVLIALDETGLLKIRQQCFANPRRHAGRVRERGSSRGSMLGCPSSERSLEPHQVPNGRTA